MFLTAYEAAHLAETVKEARRRYWKRFKLEHMVPATKVEDGEHP